MNKKHTILYLIILFALALRLYGINYEIPHPDDHTTLDGAMYYGLAHVAPSTEFGLINLHVWPGVTLVYIQTVLFTLYYLIGRLVGFFPDIAAFRNYYLSDPSNFFIIGRIVSVLFGVGTVWVLYYLARRLYNHKVGLMAALFLSTSFIHSFHSQFIRPDIPTTFFAMLTILYCLMILEKKDQKYYIYTGIFTGLAIATKFTSGLLLLPIAAAFIMSEKDTLFNDTPVNTNNGFVLMLPIILGVLLLLGRISASFLDIPGLIGAVITLNDEIDKTTMAFLMFVLNIGAVLGIVLIFTGIVMRISSSVRNCILNLLWNKKILSAMGAVTISFIVFDPIFFLKLKDQLKIFIYTPMFMGKNDLFAGAGSLGFFGNFWWYITGSLNWGAGVAIEIMAGLGIVIALYRRKKEDMLILVFPVLYFAVICNGNLKWERWVLPLIPFMAIYAASFLYFTSEKIFNGRLSARWINIVLLVVSISVIAVPAYDTLRYDFMITHKDTRTIAKEWVEVNIPSKSKIGQDAYTGDISGDIFQITKKYTLGDKPLKYYIENNYQYLMVSDTQYKRFMAEPEKFPQTAEFYRTLFARGDLIKKFNSGSDLWPILENRFKKYHIHFSPEIKIIRIDDI